MKAGRSFFSSLFSYSVILGKCWVLIMTQTAKSKMWWGQFVHLLQTVNDEFIFYISTFWKHNCLNAVFRERPLQTPYRNMVNEYKMIFKSQNVTEGPKRSYNTEMMIRWLVIFSPDISSGQFCFLKSNNPHGDFLTPGMLDRSSVSLFWYWEELQSPRRLTLLLWRSCWLTGERERGGVSHRWTIVIIPFIVTLLCFITGGFKDGTHCSEIRLV